MKYAALLFLSVAAIFICLLSGEQFISPAELFAGENQTLQSILWNLRIPRICVALVSGGALAVSGTVFQAVLKNPLADPYTAGISGGASLGAAIGIILQPNGAGIMLFAFCGSLLAVTAVEALSRKFVYGSMSLILSGIAISFIMSSAVMLLFSFAMSEEIHRVMLWMMGDLSIARSSFLPTGAVICSILFVFIMLHHRHCDLISFGSEFSKASGMSVGSMRLLFWAASMLTAVSVSLTGIISFVGLIVPHALRYVVGSLHIRLLPLAALCGGIFLMCCDAIGRTAASPYEVPAGVITGFCGGIFFLVYMLTGKQNA